MQIPRRILIPVGFAALCAVLLGVLFWWQLTETKSLLKRELSQQTNTTTDTGATVDIAPTSDDPRDEALTHMRAGDLLALQGEWADAATEFNKAVGAGGGLPALRKLAQAQLQMRDIRGVRATLEQLKRAGARPEDVLLLESIIELRTAEIAQAKDLLDHAPDSPQKHYALALYDIIQGDHTSAQSELKLVINGWEPVLRSYAKTLQAAYDEYALFPESPNIHLVTLLSRALAQVQECELALPLLSQVTQQQDDYRDAWIVQGYCELTTARSQEALASLERAYALDPQKPEIQYFLARTYAALGDDKNAITFLQYALKNGFSPEKEARVLLAKEALKVGDGTTALEQYDVLTSGADTDIDMFTGYVEAAVSLGKKDEAYVKAQEATNKWPQDARAFDLLGEAAIATGRKPEAKQALEKALSLDPNLQSAKDRMKGL